MVSTIRRRRRNAENIEEMTQDEFNRYAAARDQYYANISPREKNDLYADIKDFEEEFRDLQNTAEKLPDEYIDQMCSTSSYPFDAVIDEVDDVDDWCQEVEEFLKKDINTLYYGDRKKRYNRDNARAYEANEFAGATHEILKLFDQWNLGDDWYGFKFKTGEEIAELLMEEMPEQAAKYPKSVFQRAAVALLKAGRLDLTEASISQTARYSKARHDRTGATRKHSGAPYFVHPQGVAKMVQVYGGTKAQIQAAYLHDTMEDTGETADHIAEQFGDEVASIVAELTNDPYEVSRLGKENYINQELVSLSHDALLVKLCDMYYNQMDYPRPEQAAIQLKNIDYLLANRSDLTDNELDVIDAITGYRS